MQTLPSFVLQHFFFVFVNNEEVLTEFQIKLQLLSSCKARAQEWNTTFRSLRVVAPFSEKQSKRQSSRRQFCCFPNISLTLSKVTTKVTEALQLTPLKQLQALVTKTSEERNGSNCISPLRS